MTSHVGRLYALAIAILVFFLDVDGGRRAALGDAQPRPIRGSRRSPLVSSAFGMESVVVGRIVHQRWAAYRNATRSPAGADRGAQSTQQLARCGERPPCASVTLPPLTVTRTS